jgi:hypothetical protein
MVHLEKVFVSGPSCAASLQAAGARADRAPRSARTLLYKCTYILFGRDTYRKTPRHPCHPMHTHARARGFCKKRDLAAGLGVMLVGKGRPAGERGGASASSSGFLQSVGVQGRGRCAGAAAAAGGGGRTGGARGLLRRVGLFRLHSGQPMVGRVGAGLSHR